MLKLQSPCILDADFNQTINTFHISPFTTSFTLPNIPEINNDNINKREQSLGLLATLDGVPDHLTCFQTEVRQPSCIGDGKTGTAIIRIVDDDRK